MLRAKVKVINKKAKEERNSVKITPVVRNSVKNWEKE